VPRPTEYAQPRATLCMKGILVGLVFASLNGAAIDNALETTGARRPRQAALRGELQARATGYELLKMVRPAGLEPATPGLGNRCSILLSYGRARKS
jgi:hypothetical protein